MIIVSPTTLLAYLQTVLQGLKSLQIEEQAKDIQKRVGELANTLPLMSGVHAEAGQHAGYHRDHFNAAHKSLGHIDKDVIKIAGSNPAVEPLLLDKPTQLDE